MNYDILEILSYVVVTITTLTMIFGIYAYNIYKIREKHRKNNVVSRRDNVDKSEEFIYFEKKEVTW